MRCESYRKWRSRRREDQPQAERHGGKCEQRMRKSPVARYARECADERKARHPREPEIRTALRKRPPHARVQQMVLYKSRGRDYKHDDAPARGLSLFGLALAVYVADEAADRSSRNYRQSFLHRMRSDDRERRGHPHCHMGFRHHRPASSASNTFSTSPLMTSVALSSAGVGSLFITMRFLPLK